MKSQEKYDECLALLAEMHDISHMMIEAGMDGDMDAVTLLEEALRVIRSVDSGIAPIKESKSDLLVFKTETNPKKLVH